MIAVYTARNSSIQLHRRLGSIKIRSRIVNTPRELSMGCGLSVKFDEVDFYRVKAQIPLCGAGSFAGIWKESGGKYQRIY
jgi:hypothetical protein